MIAGVAGCDAMFLLNVIVWYAMGHKRTSTFMDQGWISQVRRKTDEGRHRQSKKAAERERER